MAISISNAAKSAACDALASTLNTVAIYTSPRPASADDAATGTSLATFTVSYNAASNGVATLSGAPATTTADATGTAYWARATDGFGNSIDGTIGVDFTLDDTNIVSGAAVNLTSSTITVS